jgi:hypothetical protein
LVPVTSAIIIINYVVVVVVVEIVHKRNVEFIRHRLHAVSKKPKAGPLFGFLFSG